MKAALFPLALNELSGRPFDKAFPPHLAYTSKPFTEGFALRPHNQSLTLNSATILITKRQLPFASLFNQWHGPHGFPQGLDVHERGIATDYLATEDGRWLLC